MDRTGGHPSGQLCPLVWGSTMGFYSESFRFEGGGRKQKIGLNRTGKSCRLRWVNYLHPGLKRGKMTPQEERLVLELHAKWGNRWSKIARKLPGRTDNEIKNYWRTHMRKKAQERKRSISPTSSSSNCCSSTGNTLDSSLYSPEEDEKASFYDTGGPDDDDDNKLMNQDDTDGCEAGYSMDDIWREIDLSEASITKPVRNIYAEHCSLLTSPPWENSLDSMWNIDTDESKMFFPTDQYPFCSEQSRSSFLAG